MRRGLLGWLYAAPFLALVASLPFPHTVALRLVCIALALVMALFAWRRAGVPAFPCKSAIAFWTLVSVLSLLWAVDPAYSLSEIKNEIGYTMATFVAFFVFTRSASELRSVLLAIAGAAAVLCAWAIAGYAWTGEWEETAGHGGVASFAALAVSVLPALVVLSTAGRPHRVAAGIVALLVAVAGVLSAQRILWPVLAAQTLIVLFFVQRQQWVRVPTRTLVLAAIAMAVLAGSIVLVAQSMRYEAPTARVAEAQIVDTDARWRNWPKVVERVMEQPWHGAGFGRQAMNMAYRDLIPADQPMFWHAHNMVLNYGLSMGLPGVAALLLLFGCLAREYGRFMIHDDPTLKVLGLAGLMLVAGVFLRNQVNDLFVRDMAILFWAMNGAFLGLGRRLIAAREAA